MHKPHKQKLTEIQGKVDKTAIIDFNTFFSNKQTKYSKKLIRLRQWHPTPVLLPGKSHGQRSLVGCSPWGRWGSDTTEQLHFYFSLSCIGEGNGNPLQCSCLENPRDGGAWGAAYGVAQSRTRLKQLSCSKEQYIILKHKHLKQTTCKTIKQIKKL